MKKNKVYSFISTKLILQPSLIHYYILYLFDLLRQNVFLRLYQWKYLLNNYHPILIIISYILPDSSKNFIFLPSDLKHCFAQIFVILENISKQKMSHFFE